MPSFEEVYEELMHHMVVEQVVVAREMTAQNEVLYQKIKKIFQRLKGSHTKILRSKHVMQKRLFEQVRPHHMPILFYKVV